MGPPKRAEPEEPSSAEAAPAAAPEVAGPLTSKLVKKGMAVRLVSDASSTGTGLKKMGKNAQVDFSASGGDSKKWVPVTDLEAAGAAGEGTGAAVVWVPERAPRISLSSAVSAARCVVCARWRSRAQSRRS